MSEKIPFKEKVGYSVGAVSINMYWQLFSMFLLYFYTDIFGISPAAAGTMFLVTRIWDSVNDLIMGAVADRTKTKWGSFRPYLLWGAFPFAIFGILTFTTPDLEGNGKLAYAYLTYTGVSMAYTVINIPFAALVGVSSTNTIERTGVSSYKFVGAFIGALIAQGLTKPIVDILGAGNEQHGFQMAALIFSSIAVCSLIYAFIFVRERVVPAQGQKKNFWKEVRLVTTCRPWLVLFSCGLFICLFVSIRSGSQVYYFKYYLEMESAVSAYLVLGSIGCIFGTLTMKFLSAKFGKRNVFIGLLSGTSFLCGIHYFLTADHLVLIYVYQFLVGALSGPIFVLMWAMYADIADYIEHEKHSRQTGVVFSAASFAQKFGWTIGGALTGWLFAGFGFVANVEQTKEALHGINLMISIVPFIGAAIAAGILLFYPLTDKQASDIEASLKLRKEVEDHT